jgi:hypothetical protein
MSSTLQQLKFSEAWNCAEISPMTEVSHLGLSAPQQRAPSGLNLGSVGPAERLDANKAKIGNEEQHTSYNNITQQTCPA